MVVYGQQLPFKNIYCHLRNVCIIFIKIVNIFLHLSTNIFSKNIPSLFAT